MFKMKTLAPIVVGVVIGLTLEEILEDTGIMDSAKRTVKRLIS